ncbi:MAG: archaeoflavoprotein AfpA [Promethearchaeota archaeon]
MVWAITGAGDLLPETFSIMEEVAKINDLEITALLSIAGNKVVKWYKLEDKLKKIANTVLIEKDANRPFIAGPLQVGKYKCLLVAPATANTVAKVVNGIADSNISNAVAQTNKTTIPIYILPVDQKKGSTTTIIPQGDEIVIIMRDIDIENTNKLKQMKGITVLEKPEEIITNIKEIIG